MRRPGSAAKGCRRPKKSVTGNLEGIRNACLSVFDKELLSTRMLAKSDTSVPDTISIGEKKQRSA